jgi:hypothetical protein
MSDRYRKGLKLNGHYVFRRVGRKSYKTCQVVKGIELGGVGVHRSQWMASLAQYVVESPEYGVLGFRLW